MYGTKAVSAQKRLSQEKPTNVTTGHTLLRRVSRRHLTFNHSEARKVLNNMLPSRIFKSRHLGIPPPLRSLLVIHPALSPSVAVQLRFRLRFDPTTVIANRSSPHRLTSSTVRSLHTSAPSASAPVRSAEQSVEEAAPEPRLSLTFTCTVSDCSERSTHQFTKRAYERGIVIVTCPKCKNKWVFGFPS